MFWVDRPHTDLPSLGREGQKASRLTFYPIKHAGFALVTFNTLHKMNCGCFKPPNLQQRFKKNKSTGLLECMNAPIFCGLYESMATRKLNDMWLLTALLTCEIEWRLREFTQQSQDLRV